jgi:hypothetical protein
MIAINGASTSAGGTAASEAGVRPDDSAELLSLWKSVFQNSRAVAADTRQYALAGHQDQAAQSNSMTEEGGEIQGARATQGGGSDGFSHSTQPYAPMEVEAAPAFQPAVAAANLSGPAPAGRGVTEPEETPASRWMSSKTGEVAESAHLAGADALLGPQDASEALETSSETASSQLSPQADSAETVSVFSRGTGIAIVVRDSSLSPEEALRSAFETAQQLTGRRSALGLLTLNGHILYQQASSTNHTPSSNPLWKMVC